MMQVVRMQNAKLQKHIANVWRGLVRSCLAARLYFYSERAEGKQPTAQNRGAPGGRGGRRSIIIAARRDGETVVFSAIRACPGICVCDSSAGTDLTRPPSL